MDCILCDTQPVPLAVVWQSSRWLIKHSNETNISGYLLLMPKRHILDLSEADYEEQSEYGIILGALMNTIRRVTGCEKVYTFSLAELVPHYHLHLIPRKETLPRAYRGRGIMSYPTVPGPSPESVQNLVPLLKTVFERKIKNVLSES